MAITEDRLNQLVDLSRSGGSSGSRGGTFDHAVAPSPGGGRRDGMLRQPLPAPGSDRQTGGPVQPFPGRDGSVDAPDAPALPPLRADQLASLSARRRAASRRLEEAITRRQQQAGQVRERANLNLSDIKDQFTGRKQSMMAEMGDKGQAFQPRFAGQGQRKLRDLKARDIANVRSGQSQQLSALDQMVARARSQRDTELDAVEADKVRMRTDLAQLLQSIGA